MGVCACSLAIGTMLVCHPYTEIYFKKKSIAKLNEVIVQLEAMETKLNDKLYTNQATEVK